MPTAVPAEWQSPMQSINIRALPRWSEMLKRLLHVPQAAAIRVGSVKGVPRVHISDKYWSNYAL